MNRHVVPAAVLLAALLAAPTLADIAPDPEFGESLAPREKTKVAMTAEVVSIRLTPEKAFVRAVFSLENTGGASRLEVGFPDVVSPRVWSSNRPPEGVSRKQLRDFAAQVDGKRIEHRHRFLQKKDSPFEKVRPGEEDNWLYGGWLLWDMAFAEGQKREVRVDYWVPHRPMYRPTLLGDRTFTYILKTGAPWHGPIGRATIDIAFEGGVTRKHLGDISPAGFTEVENGIRWVLEDLEPTEDVRIVVRKYTDATDAAGSYLAFADARQKAGKPADAAFFLARAARCQELTQRYDACIASCRRIIAYEDATRAKGAGAMVKLWWKDPYVPWECLVVSCLVKLDRPDEARVTAKEAVAAIRVLLADPKRSRWVRRDELEATAKRLDSFGAGGPYAD